MVLADEADLHSFSITFPILILIGCYSQNTYQSFDTYKNVLTTGAIMLKALPRKPRKAYSHEWVSFVDIKRTEN